MDAKDFLRQVRTLDVLIDSKQKEIERLESASYYPRGNTLENLAIKIIEYKQELNNDIDKFIDTKREVQSVVDQISNADLVDILYRRYFQYQTWERIAVDKNFVIQWLHKLHARALIEVQNLLNKR